MRVLSLPLNSPLMRVLTGVELLLAGTNDWEAYAPKEVTRIVYQLIFYFLIIFGCV